MNHFECDTLSSDVDVNDMASVSAFLNLQPRQNIDQLPWGINGSKPDVSFTIAHNHQGIYLKYLVTEKHFRALCRQTNDPVYTDSCVEFFIAFPGDEAYYNFEFNCAGVALMGYGTGKQREVLPVSTVEKIRALTGIQPRDTKTGWHKWELTLFIPFEVFIYHNVKSLKGETCKANFFKCGDELPEPHFMSWNYIENPVPEFHLPAFFGSISFV